jgi:hypothetical protein
MGGHFQAFQGSCHTGAERILSDILIQQGKQVNHPHIIIPFQTLFRQHSVDLIPEQGTLFHPVFD